LKEKGEKQVVVDEIVVFIEDLRKQ